MIEEEANHNLNSSRLSVFIERKLALWQIHFCFSTNTLMLLEKHYRSAWYPTLHSAHEQKRLYQRRAPSADCSHNAQGSQHIWGLFSRTRALAVGLVPTKRSNTTWTSLVTFCKIDCINCTGLFSSPIDGRFSFASVFDLKTNVFAANVDEKDAGSV